MIYMGISSANVILSFYKKKDRAAYCFLQNDNHISNFEIFLLEKFILCFLRKHKIKCIVFLKVGICYIYGLCLWGSDP